MDKVNHVAIQVDDIDIAVQWYMQKFDTKLLYQDESWALIQFDNLSLALVLPNQHPPHFAIDNQEAEKYGELTKHRDGTSSIYIKDPFGNSVEIIKS